MKPVFTKRNIIAAGVVFILIVLALMLQLSSLSERLSKEMALSGAHIQAHSIIDMRKLYTSDVVDRLITLGVKVNHDSERNGSIPLPVTFTMKFGDLIFRHLGTQVKLYSDYPFPWRKDRAPLDDFERRAIIELRRNPDAPYYRFEDLKGEQTLRYAIADRMTRQCVQCHNAHPQSPRRDWKVGDVRGALAVTRPITGLVKEIRSRFHATFLLTISLIVLGILGFVLLTEWLRKASLKLKETALQLKTANKELEVFNYSIAHDLRSPLTTLKGFSQVLLEHQFNRLDAQGRECVNAIAHDVDRMSRLIGDILHLSQAERAEIKRERVDLSQTASSIASEFIAAHPERKVEFKIEPGLTAVGDPPLLRIVLENLLGNAWKYTGKRGLAIIEFGKTAKTGADAFFVRDNGAGFNMAHSAQLFTAYHRLHSHADFPGIGIGLATVRRIIQRHDGKAWAEGEVDKGAAFYFTLPKNS